MLEHVLIQRSKKIEMDEKKVTFNKDKMFLSEQIPLEE